MTCFRLGILKLKFGKVARRVENHRYIQSIAHDFIALAKCQPEVTSTRPLTVVKDYIYHTGLTWVTNSNCTTSQIGSRIFEYSPHATNTNRRPLHAAPDVVFSSCRIANRGSVQAPVSDSDQHLCVYRPHQPYLLRAL